MDWKKRTMWLAKSADFELAVCHVPEGTKNSGSFPAYTWVVRETELMRVVAHGESLTELEAKERAASAACAAH